MLCLFQVYCEKIKIRLFQINWEKKSNLKKVKYSWIFGVFQYYLGKDIEIRSSFVKENKGFLLMVVFVIGNW